MKSDVPSWMQEPEVAPPPPSGGVREHWRASPRFRRRVAVAASLLVVAAGLGIALGLLPERPPRHQDRGGGTATGVEVYLVGAFVAAFALCFLFACYRLARELRGVSTGKGRATGPSPRDFEADRGTARMWWSLGRRG